MVRSRKPPSQTWKAFLRNQMIDTAAIDFFTVPAATFKTLYVFLIIPHERRMIIHFHVTNSPKSAWTGQ